MKKAKVQRQYGLWNSPITPISLARGNRFNDVVWDHSGSLVWSEWRSSRGVLVVGPPDGQAPRDLNSEFSVQAKVGYGGGDFTAAFGNAYFVEASSGRIYRQPLTAGSAQALTPAFGSAASPTVSPDGKWLLFVHCYEGRDSIAVVDTDGKFWSQKIASGDDFYMQPTWHPDGKSCAWIAWNHPNMPWDGTYLRLVRLQFDARGLPAVEQVETIAGDEKTSVMQPEFSPDGRYLAYISDASGWWQLYLYDLEKKTHQQLTSVEAEHGGPAWIQGNRHYAFSPDSKSLFFLRNQKGFISLNQIDLASGSEQIVALDEIYTYLFQISVSPKGIAFLASGGQVSERVITLGFSEASGKENELEKRERIWDRATSEELASSAYSQPQAIQWKGLDGGNAHGLYYPPHSLEFSGIGQPPLLVLIHGGPTSQVLNSFNQQAQYFATRGYAVLSVNYRGSTGYGREYRDLLRGNWGLYDVQDAVTGAKHLASKGLADEKRFVIMGGSAGGFTVLKALEDYPTFFKAGICLYGVSNQFTLAAETHKFEQHYLDTMLGPLPEASDLYRERSPIFFADRIQDAIAVFQGADDVVVPQNQMDEIVAVLERQGVPHIYHIYQGEGHGFRKTETIEHFYKTVEKFLQQYVIFA